MAETKTVRWNSMKRMPRKSGNIWLKGTRKAYLGWFDLKTQQLISSAPGWETFSGWRATAPPK